MSNLYANNFYEIIPIILNNDNLRNEILQLIDTRHIFGKVIEENFRNQEFRNILKQLITGEIKNLDSAALQIENRISKENSQYAHNNQVFSSNWAERLLRSQLSRFYNQAIMERLISDGKKKCFIPHSNYEDKNSRCTKELAGKIHNIKELYDPFIRIYEEGKYDKNVLIIPHHPNCTHVICPTDE